MKTNLFLYSIFITLITTIFLLTSCEKEVDFEGQLPDPKLVLNCFVEADSLIAVQISRSWNIAEGKPFFHPGIVVKNPCFLYDAEVSLYINGVLQSPMQTRPLPEPPEEEWIGYEIPEWTHRSTSVAREGDVIRMVARYKDYPGVSAETTVPGKTSILVIDTMRFIDQDSNLSMRFLIKFKDLEAGVKNYYRLRVNEEMSEDNINWNVGVDLGWYGPISYTYDQDAALSDGYKEPIGELLGNGIRNIYGLFNDELFDGKEYTINISSIPRFSGKTVFYDVDGSHEKMIYRRYIFKLVTLSPSAYTYLKSRTRYDDYGNNDFTSEPTVIYNNILGGLGILGAFHTDTTPILMPEE